MQAEARTFDVGKEFPDDISRPNFGIIQVIKTADQIYYRDKTLYSKMTIKIGSELIQKDNNGQKAAKKGKNKKKKKAKNEGQLQSAEIFRPTNMATKPEPIPDDKSGRTKMAVNCAQIRQSDKSTQTDDAAIKQQPIRSDKIPPTKTTNKAKSAKCANNVSRSKAKSGRKWAKAAASNGKNAANESGTTELGELVEKVNKNAVKFRRVVAHCVQNPHVLHLLYALEKRQSSVEKLTKEVAKRVEKMEHNQRESLKTTGP